MYPKVDQINASTINLGLGLSLDGGKKYNVQRKQPLSFAASHPRTLIITPEYMQILPAAPDSLAAPTGKVTNVPMGSIIGVKVSRKHPKMVRVLVFREKETKRYDFECNNKDDAQDIVADVEKVWTLRELWRMFDDRNYSTPCLCSHETSLLQLFHSQSLYHCDRLLQWAISQ